MAASSYSAYKDGENSNEIQLMRELMFKILIIGDFGVGKTAIIRRYTEGMFSPSYKLTIGVDFALKSIVWDNHTVVNLQLWDIAGHERFGYMTRVYYKYSIAAIIVYDLSRPATFDSVVKVNETVELAQHRWHTDVKDKVTLQDGRPIPVIILANKCDIDSVNIDVRSLSRFCEQHNIAKWFYTSAKEDININEAIHFLVQKIIEAKSESDIYSSPSNGCCDSVSLKPEEPVVKRNRCCR